MDRKKLIVIGAGGIVLFIVAFLIGYFSRSTSCSQSSCNQSPNKLPITDNELDEIHQSIANLMETKELRANMRLYKADLLYECIRARAQWNVSGFST